MMKIKPASLWFALFLGALAALPPISIDLALPALGAIGRGLDSSASTAGLTLSLFMAGFAGGPIVYGPLADRHGRKPVLLTGLVLFALGGLAAACAPTIAVLLGARLVQGAGAGAGMTLAFAIVRDLFEGTAMQRRLAAITVVANVAPVVAPSIGVALLAVLGWRGIYGVMALCGAAVALVTSWGLAESAPARNAGEPRRAQNATATRDEVGGNGNDGGSVNVNVNVNVNGGEGNSNSSVVAMLAALGQNYRRLLTHRGVLAHILINGFGFGWMFAYVAASPLILLDVLHVSPVLYSAMFALTGSAIVVGATLNERLGAHGVDPEHVLAAAICTAVAATAMLVALCMLHTLTLVHAMPCFAMATFCFGLAAPSAARGALNPLPQFAGAAGGLLTSLQMLCGAASSSLVAFLFPREGALAASGVMLGFALAAAATWIWLRASPRVHPRLVRSSQ
ncbi:MFS transporter [Burkholderia sp. L27(2015)]|uniref:MFS transporter n=1 Tax=Burkholderia sp. L27(2015) TaxID=1641858 RepID=UPI00131CAECE|nr:MFS transporter [Burkholderia sp. L27(2015)]